MSNRPNILFVMTDDHAAHAMSCYGSRINRTPNMDRIAREGMRFDNFLCTNSICTPSRGTILTGTYSHINRVTTLQTPLPPGTLTYPKLLKESGYQTVMIGKWHLHSVPEGYDHYSVLWTHGGHGTYFDPVMLEDGKEVPYQGYVTDVTTKLSLDWLRRRDRSKPFCLMTHHKAPHRSWLVDDAHKHLYANEEIPYPATFDDDYANRAEAAKVATMRIERDFYPRDVKVDIPAGKGPNDKLIPGEIVGAIKLRMEEGREQGFASPQEFKKWMYQRYIKDYLRCVAGVDDSLGEMLKYLDEEGLAEDTIVIYTSDQGFFLGDHGWYDKRFMYEESLRMPFVVRYPRGIKPGSVNGDIVINNDIAPTFLDYAGLPAEKSMQGTSFRPLMEGHRPAGWRDAMYYRYWMHKGDHNVYAHYGVRTAEYKLIYYYADALGQAGTIDAKHKPEWELFDLGKDPMEMMNRYRDPAYAGTVRELTKELHRLQASCGDTRYPEDR
jgi:arylsulfatase A-like enzyme